MKSLTQYIIESITAVNVEEYQDYVGDKAGKVQYRLRKDGYSNAVKSWIKDGDRNTIAYYSYYNKDAENKIIYVKYSLSKNKPDTVISVTTPNK